MYRRPLQVAARSVVRAAGSRTAKVLEQESFLGASAPFQCPGTSCLTQSHTLHTNTQLFSVKETPQQAQEEIGPFTRLFEAMGFTLRLKYNKWVIKFAALRMYTCCVEKINYDEFFERFALPDTLNSWFLVTQLHVWMCLVRMRQEGREGKYLCHYVVYVMWEDVEQRSRIMGINAAQRKKALKAMAENFYGAVFGYDEGIVSDDRVLAAALWRNLFCCQCEDPQQLELLVEYVRKQMQFIDSLDGKDLLLTGEVQWRPLVEENAQSILKVVRPTYNDAGL